MSSAFTGLRENDLIASYGVKTRFTVQLAQRVNMRLDYGRSDDDDAICLSVGEAF